MMGDQDIGWLWDGSWENCWREIDTSDGTGAEIF